MINIVISEKQEQIALVSRCRKYRGKHFIIANENSLKIPLPLEIPLKYRQIIQQCICRVSRDRIKLGQVNGYPDLFVPSLRLYIEMKKKGGVVSEEQKECHAELIKAGYQVEICYSAMEAWAVIEEVESKRNEQQ